MIPSHSQIHHALQEYFIEQKIRPDIVAEIQDEEKNKTPSFGFKNHHRF